MLFFSSGSSNREQQTGIRPEGCWQRGCCACGQNRDQVGRRTNGCFGFTPVHHHIGRWSLRSQRPHSGGKSITFPPDVIYSFIFFITVVFFRVVTVQNISQVHDSDGEVLRMRSASEQPMFSQGPASDPRPVDGAQKQGR